MRKQEPSQAPASPPERARVIVDPSALDRLADLNAACRAIAGSETLDDLLRAVTEAAQSVIGTHQAVTSRLFDGWEGAHTHVALSDKYAEYRDFDVPPRGLGVLNAVTRENQTLRLSREELPHHPDWRGLADAPGHPPLPDYLAAPLISRHGRNIGLIQLADKVDGSKFTEDDEVLLIQVAQMASASLEHVELLERERAVRHELESRARESRLAATVGMALASAESLDEQLGRCAQAMVDELDGAFARIWTREDEVLVLRASAGHYTHLDGDHGRIPVGALKIGRIAATVEPHLTNDVANDPNISDPVWAEHEGMVAFAGYPLVVAGSCIGVMALFARRPLSDATMSALASVADVIAVGIEQARHAERLRRRGAQLQQLAEVASAINASGSLEEVLELSATSARTIIGACRAAASITEGHGWSEAISAVSPSGCDGPSGPSGDRSLTAPLSDPDGTSFGLIELSGKVQGDFSEADRAIVAQLAGIASSALHKTRLYEDRVRVAQALQRSLLPPSLPDIAGVDLAARYQAGTEDVGGDFYDVFPLRPSTWGIVIGDVRGKGPEAAALTALARHSARTASMLQRLPRAVLTVMNEALHDVNDDEQFCSAAYLRLTVGKVLRLRYSSGGHPPMLVVHRDGRTEALPPTGPLVGLFPHIDIDDRAVAVEPGDTLVAYTDGITEARRSGEQFGFERLRHLVVAQRQRSADDIAQAIIDAAGTFRADGETDDAAVVVVRLRADA